MSSPSCSCSSSCSSCSSPGGWPSSSSAVPPPGRVADFPPVLVGRGRGSPALRRLLRPRRRLLAAGLAVAAAGACLTAARTAPTPSGEGAKGVPARVAADRAGPDGRAGAGGRAGSDGRAGAGAAESAGAGSAAGTGMPPPGPGGRPVAAPVRIADAAAVELLRPGDRVDVIAAGAVVPGDPAGGVSGARLVARRALVRDIPRTTTASGAGSPQDGALVVLEVPRRTATRLAGAAAVSPLAVTLC